MIQFEWYIVSEINNVVHDVPSKPPNLTMIDFKYTHFVYEDHENFPKDFVEIVYASVESPTHLLRNLTSLFM